MHEGSLAGPVLPQQCLNFSRSHCEVGPAQCLHGAESFLNPAELESRGHGSEAGGMVVELPLELESFRQM